MRPKKMQGMPTNKKNNNASGIKTEKINLLKGVEVCLKQQNNKT